MILLDTSAVYALASAEDPRHRDAVTLAGRVAASGEPLLLHSYILVETFALLHRRRGFAAALEADRGLARCAFVAVDRPLHDRGIERLRSSGSRRLSLVDAVSFALMEERGIEEAFAFDPDFERAGFRLYDGR